MKTRLMTAVILLTLMSLIFTALPTSIFGAATINSMVNLQRADKNNSGSGYYFHNPSNTLTLSGVNIDTDDEYGMKVKVGVTIVLEGDNYIRGGDIALFCPGDFTIKGSGSLTLVSGGKGIVVNTNDTGDKFRLLEGTLDIKSVDEAIYAANAGVALAGGKVTMDVANADCHAISSRSLTISGGTELKTNSSLYTSYKTNITAANLDIYTSNDRPALSSDGQLLMADMALKTLASNGEMVDTALEEYAGQTQITTKSTVKRVTPSIIFGEGVPVAVDYVILVLAIVALAALIGVPILRHKQRIKRLEESGVAGNAKKKRSAK